MPRHSKSADLTALQETHKAGPPRAGLTQSQWLYESLVRIARDRQTSESQPFYTVREVAHCFGMSTSTVAGVYRRLEKEGLLIRIRGARTLLTAREESTRHPVRSLVGIVCWLPGFVAHAEHRRFVMALEESLRRHGYVPVLIFFRQNENVQPAFFDRLLGYELDTMLWMNPLREMRQLRLRLKDRGISSLGIGGRAAPDCDFIIDDHAAYRSAVRTWKKKGVHEVFLMMRQSRESSLPAYVRHMLDRESMPWTFLDIPDDAADAYLDALPGGPHKALWVCDDMRWERLCFQAPDAMCRVFRRTRVLLRNSLPIRPDLLRGIAVDYVSVDWTRFAERIASHLSEPPPEPMHSVFMPDMPAIELAADFRKG